VGHRRIVESAAVPRADILVPEANSMHRAARYVVSLFLAAAIAAPLSKLTAAAPQNTNVQVRVYDRDHRDYHNWDDREDRAYRGFLAERHESYRVYSRQKHKTQRDYWTWRHEHPDHE
jgi:hypothetical protein